jgi:hypothetical protein
MYMHIYEKSMTPGAGPILTLGLLFKFGRYTLKDVSCHITLSYTSFGFSLEDF